MHTKPVNPLIDPLEICVKKYVVLKNYISGLELTGSQSEINPFRWCDSEYGTLWAGPVSGWRRSPNVPSGMLVHPCRIGPRKGPV